MSSFSWYKERRYLHFDMPIGPTAAARIVTDPSKVAKRSFLPFLCYEIETKKIFVDDKHKICTKPKIRPIAYASHVDAHIYSFYSDMLSSLYESELERLKLGENVLAFRQLGRSNIDFALEAFNQIRARQECSVVALDISGFFDNLDHSQLKNAWARLLDKGNLPEDHFAVFKSLTRYSKVDKRKLYEALGLSQNRRPSGIRRLCEPAVFRSVVRGRGLIVPHTSRKGIPQGSPISAMLSNLYMLEFDAKMKATVEEQGGVYLRYCDDMLFIIPTEFEDSVAGSAAIEIKNLKLDINHKKTEIRSFKREGEKLVSFAYGASKVPTEKPLQYLGFLFDGEDIRIRSASLARYSERMRRGVELAKKTKRKHDITRVNRGELARPLYKRKLYERYSHLGKRNFIRYGLNAAEVMDSKAIRRQLRPLWDRLHKQIEKPLRSNRTHK